MRWIVSFVMVGLEWLVSAWLFMVIVGIVHAAWIPGVPTVGFGFALFITGLISAALAARAIFTAVVSGLVGDE